MQRARRHEGTRPNSRDQIVLDVSAARSPANVCMALRRLWHPVRFHTRSQTPKGRYPGPGPSVAGGVCRPDRPMLPHPTIQLVATLSRSPYVNRGDGAASRPGRPAGHGHGRGPLRRGGGAEAEHALATVGSRPWWAPQATAAPPPPTSGPHAHAVVAPGALPGLASEATSP